MTESELGKIVLLDSGTLAPFLKRLDKQGYIHRTIPDSNEQRRFISLTESGEVLKDLALSVPCHMDGYLPLQEQEFRLLKPLLDKTIIKMEK